MLFSRGTSSSSPELAYSSIRNLDRPVTDRIVVKRERLQQQCSEATESLTPTTR